MNKLTLVTALAMMITASASAGTTVHQIVGDLMLVNDPNTAGSDYVATFDVGNIGTVLDVGVYISWSSEYIGDNLFQLAFNGALASMIDNDESTFAIVDGNYMWDDEAPLSFFDGIVVPGGGDPEFLPEGSYHSSDPSNSLLSVFDGMDAAGTWTMTMSNTFGTVTEVYGISLMITVDDASGEVIPLPAPILLGLTGLVSVAAFRRRLRTI